MRVFLQRIKSSDQGTFGVLYIPSAMRMWHSIELPWRDNKPNISCIPSGTYDAEMVMSPRFGKKLYRLRDTQTAPRSAILLHTGNWAGDKEKGYMSNFEGCIGIGLGYSENLNGQEAITSSVKAFDEFYATTKGEPIKLTISDVVP